MSGSDHSRYESDHVRQCLLATTMRAMITIIGLYHVYYAMKLPVWYIHSKVMTFYRWRFSSARLMRWPQLPFLSEEFPLGFLLLKWMAICPLFERCYTTFGRAPDFRHILNLILTHGWCTYHKYSAIRKCIILEVVGSN